MELRRLSKDNYDELIALLNYVFGKKNNREVSFELDLPSMCKRTDEAMGKHIGVFENERLVAALGIYPLPCRIDGEDLLFSTVGNVAVHPDFEGRGYMGLMMTEAMKELERIGADASRLGGARQRYNRFGYESAGVGHTFVLGDHNVKHAIQSYECYSFKRIEKNDTDALLYANSLHERESIHAIRSEKDECFGVWAASVAWQATPYIIMKDGKRAGYFSLGKDLTTVAELYAEDKSERVRMLAAVMSMTGKKSCSITVADYDRELTKDLAAVCASMSTAPICHFKIIDFAKVANALMHLKANYSEMPSGEFILGIEGYDSLRLFSDGERVSAERSDKKPEIMLDKLTATRFLFGHFPCSLIANVPAYVRAWLPLPLFWNLQDRV